MGKLGREGVAGVCEGPDSGPSCEPKGHIGDWKTMTRAGVT